MQVFPEQDIEKKSEKKELLCHLSYFELLVPSVFILKF